MSRYNYFTSHVTSHFSTSLTSEIPCYLVRYIGRTCATICVFSLVLAAGCGEDRYRTPRAASRIATAPPPGGFGASVAPSPINIPAIPANDLRTDLGITSEKYGDYSNRDLVDKADIFWKLYWMTKGLAEGRISADIPAELEKMARTVGKLHPDRNVEAISDILKDLKTGMEADRLSGQLNARGVPVASLNWAGGQVALSNQLKEKKPHGHVKNLQRSAVLSASVARDVEAWAGNHHAPPEQVHRKSIESAAGKTLHLGDTLDEERKQAGEHLIGRDKVIGSATGLGNPYQSAFPTSPIR